MDASTITHPRKAIREAVVEQLQYARTRADERVFPSREVPWKRVELPGIAVYALEESADSDKLPGELVRTLRLAVLAVVSYTERVDDEVDELCLEIEKAIDKDPTFGGKAVDAYLTGTLIDVAEENGRPVAAARLTYDVRYMT